MSAPFLPDRARRDGGGGTTRVLFVDDDPFVLSGLRHALQPHRERIEASWAGDVAGALVLLDTGPFDVVVSDMRLPPHDGAEVLRLVAARHPATRRIILSGQASEDALRAAPVAHRLLSRSCTVETLLDTIDELTRQQEQQGTTLAELLGRVAALPAPPTLFVRLNALMADPGAGTADVTALIKDAPLVVARLLQLVNSSFFRAPQQIGGIDAAIARLGLRLVRAVVLGEGVFAAAGVHADVVEASRRHGFEAMAIASAIAPPALRDTTMTAALLARIGAPLLASVAPEHLADIRAAVAAGAHAAVVERFTIGVTCDAFAAHMLNVWELPAEIVTAVAWHRREPVAWDATGIVAVACRLADGLPVDIEGLCAIGAPASAIATLLNGAG